MIDLLNNLLVKKTSGAGVWDGDGMNAAYDLMLYWYNLEMD